MDNITKLINKYKPLVQPGNKKTIPELCDFLERNMSAIKINFNLINKLTRKIMLKSINYYIKVNNQCLPLSKLQFIAYKIPRNGAGALYYNYSYIPIIVEGHDNDSIYVVFEKHLEDYIYCNCNKLFLDLTITRGISVYDYDHNTSRLIEYLSRIEANENQWY